MAGDPRLGWRQRRKLRDDMAAGRIGDRPPHPPCEHPRCKYPGVPIDYGAPPGAPLAYELDERIPRARGGDPLDPDNVRPAHAGCNRAAGARMTNTRGTQAPTPTPPPSWVPSRDW